MKKWLIGLSFFTATLAYADVYRCVMPNKEIKFSDQPCTSGEQKAVDPDARKTELKKEAEKEKQRLEVANKEQKASRAAGTAGDVKEAREKFLQIDTAKIKAIAECQKAGCTASEYRSLLTGRPPAMVEDVLKCSTQEIGANRFRYCNVSLLDAGKLRTARLQIITGNVTGLPNGVISYDRINEVNVY